MHQTPHSASRDIEMTTIVCHGFARERVSDHRAILKWLLDMCDRIAISPDLITVTAPGFRDRPLKKDRAIPRLIRAELGSVSAIGLYETFPTADWFEVDHRGHAGYDSDHDYFDVSVESRMISEARVYEIIVEALEVLAAEYAYVFKMPRHRGPLLYAIGLNLAPPPGRDQLPYEEGLRIGFWGHTWMPERRYMYGKLRGVYPYNVLTRTQLDAPIHGQTLECWIRMSTNSSRGDLVALDNGRLLWRVPDESISPLEAELASQDLILLPP